MQSVVVVVSGIDAKKTTLAGVYGRVKKSLKK